MHYLLVDLANTFFRARHSASRYATVDEKVGMAIHITMMSINSMARKFNPDHVVIALEGRSWRKDFYHPYKRHRQDAKAALSPKDVEEDKMFWEAYDHLIVYLRDHTNCSVIRCPFGEGDDIIARWINLHPTDTHTIISSDSDFVQLVADNVNQYNGISDELSTINGIFNSKDQRVLDKKTKEPKVIPDPEWLLFEKIIRGDTSDNIFSAYPGVRTNGTKTKVGIREAFEDRSKKGYSYNNFMLQRWIDHEETEHRVLDDFERNRTLIDLTAQPEEIKIIIDQSILEQLSHRDVGQVGVRFLRFCGKFDLIKLSEQADQFGKWLNKSYNGVLTNHVTEA